MATSCKDGKLGHSNSSSSLDNGKYVGYTPEQVEALERLYHEHPKPSSLRHQRVIRECPILSNMEPRQIKVWLQNRRCREMQRKEASRLQAVNRKLTAMNKLSMEENDRLQQQVSQLVCENGYFRQHTQNTMLATKDTSCESLVTSDQHQLTSQHPPRDARRDFSRVSFKGHWNCCGVGPNAWNEAWPGFHWNRCYFSWLHWCGGTTMRTRGLEPARVAEILKDQPSWFRDCRAVDVLNVLLTANGGTIELLYVLLCFSIGSLDFKPGFGSL